MSLIKCPECGKEISDKAEICINCGCPISKKTLDRKYQNSKNMICNINGKLYDFSDIYQKMEEIFNKSSYPAVLIRKKTQISFEDSIEFCKIVKENGEIPKQFSVNEQKPAIPHCPKCGSTSITAGQRGFKLTTGFLGSNKTVNRCANCGHAWKPGK